MTDVNLMNEFDPKIKKIVKDALQYENIINEFPKYIGDLEKLLQDDRLKIENMKNFIVDTGIPVPFSGSNSTAVANGSSTTPKNKRKRTSSDTSDDSGFQVETLKGGCKVLVLPSGSVPSNHHIVDLIHKIKPCLTKLNEVFNKLRIFIVFLIPKIEDGNNFGVQIQEDILEEIKSIEHDSLVYYDQFSKYYLTRAKAVSKIAKYPHVDDFRQVLREVDERFLMEMRQMIREITHHYSSFYDLYKKNKDKIKNPKNDNTSTMY